jgi:hypothetical protein
MALVTVRDETFPGSPADEMTLEFLTERVTVRELIRGRVYQEVTEYNAARAQRPRLPFPLTQTERQLNAPRPALRLDWEEHYQRAIRAFQKNGFLILVDDQQVDDLDADIELKAETQVTFLRLMPLAGG